MLFVVVGLPMALDKVPPNSWYGFRTTKTLSSPSIWYPANRVMGRDLCVGGCLTAIGALVVALGLGESGGDRVHTLDLIWMLSLLLIVVAHGFLVLSKL
jgi:hypothetical protein